LSKRSDLNKAGVRSMHLIYVDDSRDEKLCVFSALALPVDQWHEAFSRVREFRRKLRRAHGIYVYKELHAWKFVSGRGHISDRIVTKGQRCAIFRDALEMTAGLPGARLFNAVFPRKQDERAFEWLLNRINRTLNTWDSYGLLICDHGKNVVYTRMVRRMYVYNPIPSQFGSWMGTGKSWKNIPLDRIVEDPFFKDSAQSYFVQLADFAAYALLRKENPLPSKSRYGLDVAFYKLNPILVLEARPRDPEGIIRP
jgi:hypothetical protein